MYKKNPNLDFRFIDLLFVSEENNPASASGKLQKIQLDTNVKTSLLEYLDEPRGLDVDPVHNLI